MNLMGVSIIGDPYVDPKGLEASYRDFLKKGTPYNPSFHGMFYGIFHLLLHEQGYKVHLVLENLKHYQEISSTLNP